MLAFSTIAESAGTLGSVFLTILSIALLVFVILAPLYLYQINYRLKRMEKLFNNANTNFDMHLIYVNKQLKNFISSNDNDL